MIAYDIFIACVGLLAWYVFIDMRMHPTLNDASYFWKLFIVLNIAIFITARTMAALFAFVNAPTFFFSAWGAVVFAHILLVIWFVNRKGL